MLLKYLKNVLKIEPHIEPAIPLGYGSTTLNRLNWGEIAIQPPK